MNRVLLLLIPLALLSSTAGAGWADRMLEDPPSEIQQQIEGGPLGPICITVQTGPPARAYQDKACASGAFPICVGICISIDVKEGGDPQEGPLDRLYRRTIDLAP